MPRYIMIEMQDHTSNEDAISFAEEINEVFQPHTPAIVVDINDDPKTFQTHFIPVTKN